MGQPKVATLEYDLAKLREDIISFLEYNKSISTADDITRRFMMDDPVEMPEPFELWLTLKKFAGYGPIPFLLPGTYLDQPYITMRQLEICSEIDPIVQRAF